MIRAMSVFCLPGIQIKSKQTDEFHDSQVVNLNPALSFKNLEN